MIYTKSCDAPDAIDRACDYIRLSANIRALNWRDYAYRAQRGIELQAAISQRPRALDNKKPREPITLVAPTKSPFVDGGNPPQLAPAKVSAAGTFWTRFLSRPSLDWVESWGFLAATWVVVVLLVVWRIA